MRDTYRTWVWAAQRWSAPRLRGLPRSPKGLSGLGWTTGNPLCHFENGFSTGCSTRPCTGSITLILFDGVSVQYGAGPQILKDVTFTLAPGSFHFVVGRSGAGKSSLLKV